MHYQNHGFQVLLFLVIHLHNTSNYAKNPMLQVAIFYLYPLTCTHSWWSYQKYINWIYIYIFFLSCLLSMWGEKSIKTFISLKKRTVEIMRLGQTTVLKYRKFNTYLNKLLDVSTWMTNCPSSRDSFFRTVPPKCLFIIYVIEILIQYLS